LLYLQHLRKRRKILAAKPRIATHALRAVDGKISYLEENKILEYLKMQLHKSYL